MFELSRENIFIRFTKLINEVSLTSLLLTLGVVNKHKFSVWGAH